MPNSRKVTPAEAWKAKRLKPRHSRMVEKAESDKKRPEKPTPGGAA